MFSQPMDDVLPIIFSMLKYEIINMYWTSKNLQGKVLEYAYTRQCRSKHAARIINISDPCYITRIYGSDIINIGSEIEIHDYVQKNENLLIWLIKNGWFERAMIYRIKPELLARIIPIKYDYKNLVCDITRDDLIKYPELSSCNYVETSLMEIIANDPNILHILPHSINTINICRDIGVKAGGLIAYHGNGLSAMDMGIKYNPEYLGVISFIDNEDWCDKLDNMAFADKCAIAIAYVINSEYNPMRVSDEWYPYINVLRYMRTLICHKKFAYKGIIPLIVYASCGDFTDTEIGKFKHVSAYNLQIIRDYIDDVTKSYICQNIRQAILIA